MIKIIISIIISFFEREIGGFDNIINTLLIFIIMDYITGIMKAIINKRLSSEIGFKGIFKKVLILFMIAVSNQLDIIFKMPGIRYIVITFYIINEGISIIENASLIGLPIPKKIKQTLNNIKTDHKWSVFDFK